jgi:thioredoxin 1
VVLADFSATWCRPCKMLAPVIDSLGEQYKEKLVIIKVDVDQSKEIAAKMHINEIPTLLLYKNGKQVWTGEGYMPGYMIRKEIDGK